jgi:DNA-binding NtrC family response regulator
MTTSRILCVHESGSVLHELEQTLTNDGCDVVLAEDGIHAVQILQDEHVDGIVLSFDMQAPDGRALRNQIRHVCPDMPVLLFSKMEEIRDMPLHVFSAYLQHHGLPTLAVAE